MSGWTGWLLIWGVPFAVGVPLTLAALLWREHRSLVRWWRLRDGRVGPRLPVVLLHGLAGFDELRLGPERGAVYFRGLEQLLETEGVVVFRPTVPAFGSVARRAEALAAQLEGLAEQTGHPRFNVIAHSMGGLDARYAISRLGADRRVASLTTVGTPHRGTPVADLAASVTGRLGVVRLARTIGLDLEALDDLTAAKLASFNDDVPNASAVFYASVVARADPKKAAPLLRPALHLLRSQSDGLVPVESQAWGEVLVEAEADHWGQIGWSKHGDPPAVLGRVFRELRARGL